MRTTVVDGLPSSQPGPDVGSTPSGVLDVAFIGSTLYGLEAGAGCSHGLAGTFNSVFRVNADGTVISIANLSAFVMAQPVAHPNADDFEPDGTWYSMVAVRGALYAVEPNHGEVDRISQSGSISRVADISATQGHIVPTAIGYHGNFFLGNLDLFPITPADAKILKLTPSGQVKTWATGLQAVLGVAFDHEGRLYALENTTCATPCFPDALHRQGRPPQRQRVLDDDRLGPAPADRDGLRARWRPVRLDLRLRRTSRRRDDRTHRARILRTPRRGSGGSVAARPSASMHRAALGEDGRHGRREGRVESRHDHPAVSGPANGV